MKNNSKSNKTTNPSGNEPPLGWWKFRKNWYIATNHSSIINKEKCAYKLETIFSTKYKQILDGITNRLQTLEGALRIALYELGKVVFKEENFLKYPDKETKESGHISNCWSRLFKC